MFIHLKNQREISWVPRPSVNKGDQVTRSKRVILHLAFAPRTIAALFLSLGYRISRWFGPTLIGRVRKEWISGLEQWLPRKRRLAMREMNKASIRRLVRELIWWRTLWPLRSIEKGVTKGIDLIGWASCFIKIVWVMKKLVIEQQNTPLVPRKDCCFLGWSDRG